MTVYEEWFNRMGIPTEWIEMFDKYLQEKEQEQEKDGTLFINTPEFSNDSVDNSLDDITVALDNLKSKVEQELPKVSNITISIDFK